MLKCREVPQEIEGLHDGQLDWRRRMALRLHLLICHHCRRYVRQLGIMLQALHHRQNHHIENVDDRQTQQILSRLSQEGRNR